MRKQARFTILAKLAATFLFILALLAVVGYVGYSQLDKVQTSLATVDRRKTLADGATEAEALLNKQAADVRGFLLYQDETMMTDFQTDSAAMMKQLDTLAATAQRAEVKGVVEQLKKAEAEYQDTVNSAAQMQRAGQSQQAATFLRAQGVTKYNSLYNMVQQFSADRDKEAESEVTAANQSADASQNRMLGVMAGAFLIGLIVIVVLARRIVRPLRALAVAAGHLATGDLTMPLLAIRDNDETGDVTRAFNGMLTSLQELVKGVTRSSEVVAGSAEQLSSTTTQVAEAAQGMSRAVTEVAEGASTQVKAVEESLSMIAELQAAIGQIAAGAQDQAASAQETSRVVDRISVEIDDMTTKARNVDRSSQQALAAARTGSAVVEQTARGMERIQESVQASSAQVAELGQLSTQIGAITDAITEIADQTNLLALNAAIEAARAGEAGRGFAVVAEEVRKLAERAGRSAHEITGLIAAIQGGTTQVVNQMEQVNSHAGEGTELAARTRDALADILRVVEQTAADTHSIIQATESLANASRLVAEAANAVAAVTEENTASTEQMAAGAEQVSVSARSITRVSEANAASAEEVSASVEEVNAQTEEIAAAAEDLERVARDLQRQVSRFRV
ncbi:MAG: methyl-accepting chemotaxis protein [Mycobacterium leprae]